MSKENKYAILIDADNTSQQYLKTVFDIITNEGIVTYRRIYGDWTSPNLQSYKQYILDFSLTPMQQFSYTSGKNATDSAMIIDAMDILYQGNVDGFCIVSSDSDFTKLASRLRESGKNVIGMGRTQTPKAFIDACNEFKYLDLFEEPVIEETKNKTSKKKPSKESQNKNEITKDQPTLSEKEILLQASIKNIIEEQSDADGWMLASQLGGIMIKKQPDFDSKHYGCKKLADLLEKLNFEIKKQRDPNNTANPNGLEVYVRIKSEK